MQHGLSLPQEGSFGCKEPARKCGRSQKLLLTSRSTSGAGALKASCPPERPQEPHKPFCPVSPSPTGGEGCEEAGAVLCMDLPWVRGQAACWQVMLVTGTGS